LSAAVCVVWKIDAVSVILHGDHMTLFGELLTAGVVAGGEQGFVKAIQGRDGRRE